MTNYSVYDFSQSFQPPLVLPRWGDAGYSGSVKALWIQVTFVIDKLLIIRQPDDRWYLSLPNGGGSVGAKTNIRSNLFLPLGKVRMGKKPPIPLEHIIIICTFAVIPLPCNISSYCVARGFCVYTRPCLAPQTPCRETSSTASDHTQRNHIRLNLPHKELGGSKN